MKKKFKNMLLSLAGGLSVINLFIGSFLIYIVETTLFILMLIRLFSRNIPARQKENKAISDFVAKFKGSLNLRRRMHNDRQTHIYKKCPHCSVMLRLPRRPGEHNVNCPRCRNDFLVKVK